MSTPVVEQTGSEVLERDLASIRGAIAMVASGVAVEVILCGLTEPETVAALVAAESRVAGVPVSIVAGLERADLVVGPRQA